MGHTHTRTYISTNNGNNNDGDARQASGIIVGYNGVRRTLKANRIRIQNVVLFRIFDSNDAHVGLAAVISDWERL